MSGPRVPDLGRAMLVTRPLARPGYKVKWMIATEEFPRARPGR